MKRDLWNEFSNAGLLFRMSTVAVTVLAVIGSISVVQFLANISPERDSGYKDRHWKMRYPDGSIRNRATGETLWTPKHDLKIPKDPDPKPAPIPGRWEASEGSNPHATGWSGAKTYTVQWSEGGRPFSYHYGSKKTAERQADKMNELKLGRFWQSDRPVEERNRIHGILTGPGMTSGNYMD